MRSLSPLLLCLCLALSACHSRPAGVLSAGKMRRVLYDYHLAQSMAETAKGGERDTCRRYVEAALAKHHTTQAQLDSSLRWYNNHPDQLADIYSHVRDRFSVQSEQLKLQTAGSSMNTFIASGGDTTDIWSSRRCFILRQGDLLNIESFSLLTDTTFHIDDKFLLRATATFLSAADAKQRDSQPRLSIALALHDTCGNTYSKTRHIATSTTVELPASSAAHQPLAQLSGFFFLQTTSSERALCVIDHIQLIRMHRHASPEESSEDTATPAVEEVAPTGEATTPTERLTPEQLREAQQAPTEGTRRIKTAPDKRTPNSVGPTRKKSTAKPQPRKAP